MSDDLVDLKLEKLAGDEEIGTGTLKTDPIRKNEIGQKQRQHRDHHDPALVVHLALCELREPQLANDQTPAQTQIGRVEKTCTSSRI